jgi:hypothetical protein
VHTYQENFNHKAWLLHQILIYSFTNKCSDLFAALLCDKATYGTLFLNVVQLRSQNLLRYLVAALLLNRNVDELVEVALPIILQEKSEYSDCFTEYVVALYEDFDFARAQALLPQLIAAAEADLLLKPFASELQLQAALLVYEVTSQIYKTVDLT